MNKKTAFANFMDGVIEAAWIAALIISPLFFNKYSSRIFEPDKIALVRSLAIIIVGVWVVDSVNYLRSKPSTSVSKEKFHKFFSKPLVIPVVFFTASIIISTTLSVAPRISLWGSYQRMQGLYTTFAYIVIFFAVLRNLRSLEQANRLVTTIIITSLPISLYGILQHYGIDPIPWGGNVERRIASNMGNSIFVSAYIIMVFPITISKILDSFTNIVKSDKPQTQDYLYGSTYLFIGLLQLIAIYYAKSRGPFLGLIGGSFFFFMLLSIYWKKKSLTYFTTAIAGFIGTFLLLLNINGSPLEPIRNSEWLGRLGQVFDMDQKTSRVRILIWDGVSDMVSPHDPLEFPDGSLDKFNIIRPFIGYGPETMHMAFNPFYPPELAYVEKRNASPDRSHNETWDSIASNGLIGLAAYMILFGSIFYYGFLQLKIITNRKLKIIYISSIAGGALLGSISFTVWQGLGFFGIGLPFGFIAGLILFLTYVSIKGNHANIRDISYPKAILLISALAGIAAHFIEINFGIAIVSTRIFFWVFAAIIVGYGSMQNVHSFQPVKETTKSYKKKITGHGRQQLFIGSVIIGIILIVLNYEFISNLEAETNIIKIIWTSFTSLGNGNRSAGVFMIIAITWAFGSLLVGNESTEIQSLSEWLKTKAAILILSFGISFIFCFVMAISLSNLAAFTPENINDLILQSKRVESLLTLFYLSLGLLILSIAYFSALGFQSSKRRVSPFLYPITTISLIFAMVFISLTNLKVIQADITFKLAEPFAANNKWPIAIELYKRAKYLAPDEDYYYLFLGRGYLEHAKTLQDSQAKQATYLTTLEDLSLAQSINPLNTDHTANLARLNSWWALQTDEQADRKTRGELSESYYNQAIVLSPNNARLKNELAILNMNILGQPEEALRIIDDSKSIDPKYDWTYALSGDFYMRIASESPETEKINEYYEKAESNYLEAIDLSSMKTLESSQGLNYFFALANLYQAKGEVDNTILTLEKSLSYALNPHDIWRIEENLAILYYQQGEIDEALQHAFSALEYAPGEETARLTDLITQLENAP